MPKIGYWSTWNLETFSRFMKKPLKYGTVIIILILLLGVTTIGYFLSEFFLKQPTRTAVPIVFSVEKGDSVKRIAKNLKTKKIINSTFNFETYVWLFGVERIFQAGEFMLTPGSSTHSLVKKLIAINTKEKKFTIIEGWHLKDISKYLKRGGLIKDNSELYYLTGRPLIDYRKNKVDFKGGWDYDFLKDKPPYLGLEGYIYPDTYRILADAKVNSLIIKALNNFDKKLTKDLRDEIKRQGKTIFEVVTLASIVEREISGYENRRMVADIFLRRMKKGMALQSDVSINYITGKGMASPLYVDLKIDSKWNTYKYPGLPLGPIGNPSIESIKAVIYPKANSNYFFLTDKQGKIYFSRDYAEHLRKKAKYIR